MVTATGQLDHITDGFHWVIWRKLFHDCPFLRWCDRKMAEAFFALSSSSVFCPNNRSSSWMRYCSRPDCVPAQRLGRIFQRLRLPRSKQLWFDLVFPADFGGGFGSTQDFQHYACLEFGTGVSSFSHDDPFLGLILLHLRTCPSSVGHYRFHSTILLELI
jgi:hypothetical protein